ncbi:hypothetical protein Nepgr_021355 [Nepenthes gracilis]|uniref:Uncharacterized protein n=1 Tax=Nepenthes gracilis TaxID=150966 RepID=A0AAD3XWY6_NEPGR|nr:hypothetical protein Nepgr_021355 [Nepenthes gracilis]
MLGTVKMRSVELFRMNAHSSTGLTDSSKLFLLGASQSNILQGYQDILDLYHKICFVVLPNFFLKMRRFCNFNSGNKTCQLHLWSRMIQV